MSFTANFHEGRHQLKELERRIGKATEQWNRTAEFLRAQGIKPDAVDMSPFTNLLPEVKEESQTVDTELDGDF